MAARAAEEAGVALEVLAATLRLQTLLAELEEAEEEMLGEARPTWASADLDRLAREVLVAQEEVLRMAARVEAAISTFRASSVPTVPWSRIGTTSSPRHGPTSRG